MGLNPTVLRDRADIITAMAASLRKAGATADEATAIRWLTGRFRYGDIVAFVDKALFEARQETVGDIMARSR